MVIVLLTGALGSVGCDRAERVDTAPGDLRGQPIVATPPPATNSMPAGMAAVSASNADSATPPPRAVAPGPDGFVHLGFDVLAGFEYASHQEPVATNAPPPPTRLPEFLRAYDHQPVAIKGYMLPMKLQSGLATELLLMRDQSMCCFGVVPKINEWVNVRMSGRGVKPIQDQPVTIYGRLEVGEVWDQGYLVTVYNLVGERLETPLDL